MRWIILAAIFLPVAVHANNLNRPTTGGVIGGPAPLSEQEQIQQQYDNLMKVQNGGTVTDQIPYYSQNQAPYYSQNQAPYYNQNPNPGYNNGYNAGYNPGYGPGTTSDPSGYGQQPAQTTSGLPQPSGPTTGFLNWTPGGHGYSH